MLSVVALVGRPNVGKSTLFNKLTKTRDALVADFPGLTRDRQYGEVSHNENTFLVVDTGGIGVEDVSVDDLMAQQSSVALNEADLVLFLVDARSGATSVDLEVAKRLHRSGKQVLLVVNKVDGLDEEAASAEFYSLGFSDLLAISAAHNRGLHAILDWIDQRIVVPEIPDLDENRKRIAFIGRPNVGKSTLVNRLLGEERVVVYDMPGTTRDSIAIPFNRENEQYLLIDTAGMRRRARIHESIEKFSVIKTMQAVETAQVCIMVMDAQEGITDQDLQLLSFVIEAGKAIVIAVNKWDHLSEDQKEKVKNGVAQKLYFAEFAKIRFISALHGTGVGLLFKDIDQAYAAAMQKLSTPHLTRLLQDMTAQHPPPLVQGRRIKMRYAHAGGQNPPVIVIHGNQLDALPDSYKRYLMNQYLKHLDIHGTPIKIEFKTGSNPYKNKHNKLTPRQAYKRKRLMKKVKKK